MQERAKLKHVNKLSRHNSLHNTKTTILKSIKTQNSLLIFLISKYYEAKPCR